MKVPNRKMTRLEHARQNVFKSLTNSVNQNCSEFVMLNKQASLKKNGRKMLDKIKDFGKQGFYYFLSFIVLYNFFVFMN